MKIIVFNCGSSSLKYKIIDSNDETVLAGGEAQRVGPKTAEPAKIFHRKNGNEDVIEVDMPNHKTALEQVMKILSKDISLIPDAVGHRVVHGGDVFSDSAIINDSVVEALEGISDLAPLHNPPALSLVKACSELFPKLPQVAVFDTGFHTTIPEYAKQYALSERLRKELAIHKFGFHGTSHRFVVEEAEAMLNIPADEFAAVSCHLGSGGASLCAVVNGKSIDNTMGYSPLQGLVMSTRCGDLGPAVTIQLLAKHLSDEKHVETILNKESGVLGLSGVSADIRDVVSTTATEGAKDSQRLRMTEEIYVWRIRKYLGAYLAAVKKPDAIIFTDTIGETVPYIRSAICSGLEAFGVKIDQERNREAHDLPVDIAAEDSKVRLLVVLTNEELAIARKTFAALKCA